MDFLYSLYDALVSINVPSDKARAVVDAMERDMGTTLATKKDLELLQLATKRDLEMVQLATKQDLQLLSQDFQVLRKEMDSRFALVDEKLDRLRSEASRDLAAQKQSIVIQLGSLIVACFGMTLAVMRFWA